MYIVKEQKEWIAEFLKANEDEKFTAKELAQAVNDSHVAPSCYEVNSITSFSTELGFILRQLGCTREKIKGRYYYRYNKAYIEKLTFTGWEKTKNLLILKNKEDINLYFDFNTKKFNILPASVCNTTYEGDERARAANYIYTSYNSPFKEWIFSYPDLWYSTPQVTLGIDFDCEPGYVKFLKENNLTICRNSYTRFQVFKNIPKANKHVVEGFAELCAEVLDWTDCNYLLCNSELFPLITKIIQNDLNNFRIAINIHSAIHNLLCSLRTLKNEDNDFSTFLDTNRGLKYNCQLMADMAKHQQDNILINRLQKINGINHLKIDEYEIVVPQNLMDLQDEGRQQNNCVGYYYNNSIINGENYIYFLRKQKNPQHSYITCRFNVLRDMIVESRYVNNQVVNNPKELQIINEIGEKIKQILSIK